MEYAVTFTDVMTAVITVGLSIFGWLLKNWVQNILKEIRKTQEQNQSIDKKYEERVAELETKTEGEIRELEKEINSFKSDFATTFVLREDYFRAMNKMEDSIRSIDQKIDRLLLLKGGKE